MDLFYLTFIYQIYLLLHLLLLILIILNMVIYQLLDHLQPHDHMVHLQLYFLHNLLDLLIHLLLMHLMYLFLYNLNLLDFI